MDFIIIAIIACIGLAICLAILGNIILWRNISYLGDSIAHSALLGVMISTIANVNDIFIITTICFIFSLGFILLYQKLSITKDSLLVFNTQLSLSVAFILLSLSGKMFNSYFFGSLLALNMNQLIIAYILLGIIIIAMIIFWQKILLISFNYEIANAEGINTFIFEVVLTFILSLVISLSIKFIGILLVPSLLILPALFALHLSNNPIYTIIISVLVAIFAVCIGVLTSIFADIPPSPIISLFLIIIIVIKFIIKYIHTKLVHKAN